MGRGPDLLMFQSSLRLSGRLTWCSTTPAAVRSSNCAPLMLNRLHVGKAPRRTCGAVQDRDQRLPVELASLKQAPEGRRPVRFGRGGEEIELAAHG